MITFREGCNHEPYVDMGNALRIEKSQSIMDGTLLLLLV